MINHILTHCNLCFLVVLNHERKQGESHLTRIAGNCWKGTAKEHTGEMALSMLGGCWANARLDARPDAWQWLRGLCALTLSGIPTRWSESERICVRFVQCLAVFMRNGQSENLYARR